MGAKVLNSLGRFLSNLNEHGGRANFPAVVKHNLNIIGECVEPGATYVITVVTGAVKDAGTDAGVYITLFGDRRGERQAEADNDENNFEQGKTDVFEEQIDDVGAIHRIRIPP